MALDFLTKAEKEGGNFWQQIENRLFWADRRHKKLDPLVKPSIVHGGITLKDGYDPLNLCIKNGRIQVAVYS